MANKMMEAVGEAQSAAERFLEPLSDVEYVEACEELASYFQTAADAKTAELEAEDDDGAD